MRALWSYVRSVVRVLMKAPGFALASIVATALGIGPNTAIFSTVYTTLLAPMPHSDPNQVALRWSRVRENRSPTSPDPDAGATWLAQSTQSSRPVADHHQHLPSPAAVKLVDQERRSGDPRVEWMTAEELVAQLDEAGIQRAVVLSAAYWFASGVWPKAKRDEGAKVRAENDWTARQAARFPTRLIAFCSVNPLRNYAIKEVERCSNNTSLKGLKLHFANSDVDVLNAEHVKKLRRVFAAANERRLPIVAHLWTGHSYGRQHAEIFLTEILPTAPDIPVQIAHFAGGGPGYTDPALAVYAEAIAAGDPATKNLYFDIATVAMDQPTEVLGRFAERIRQIGLHRILFGTDAGASVRQAWTTFRTTVPLREDELRTIATNVAPYLR